MLKIAYKCCLDYHQKGLQFIRESCETARHLKVVDQPHALEKPGSIFAASSRLFRTMTLSFFHLRLRALQIEAIPLSCNLPG